MSIKLSQKIYKCKKLYLKKFFSNINIRIKINKTIFIYNTTINSFFAEIAQLVEQRSRKA